MIVIDANVAAKWYMPERGTEAALELLDGPEQLYAPELIRLEVLAAITRRVRKGESTVEEARSMRHAWLKHLHEGAVWLTPESDVLQDATEYSMKLPHTLQDCLYLAAAKRLDATLITADRPFHDRVKTFYKKISMLPGCERN